MSESNYLVIKQLCCTRDTQFANRMLHCEDVGHTAAGAAACVGDWCPDLGLGLFTGNLDGVVRIYYSEKPFIPKTELTGFIGDDKNYISDHNGVNVQVDASRHDRPDAKFNIITHNLEGLCYRGEAKKVERFRFIKDRLTDYFRPHIRDGTIMLVQELALQLHKKDMKEQQDLLTKNMDVVLEKLRKLNRNLVGVTDEYTGCLIYDRTKWFPMNEIKINRIGSKKYSNAYLMKFIPYPDLMIWVVNIHLKAYGNSAKPQSVVNKSHINELTHILEMTIHNNPKKYPIYLCGDFNNGTVKAELIMEAATYVPMKYRLFYEDPYSEKESLTEEQLDYLLDALRD